MNLSSKKVRRNFLGLHSLKKQSLLLVIALTFLTFGQIDTKLVTTQTISDNELQQVKLPGGGGITNINLDNENVIIQRSGVIHFQESAERLKQLIITGTDYEDDTFRVEVSEHICDTILVDGGKGGFDVLEIIGSECIDVVYNFYNNNDGNVEYDFNDDSNTDLVIEYRGLEPISSSVNASNVTLDYGSSDETITISDAGSGQTKVDSDQGESSTFNNPTNSLTINGGGGADVFEITSFSSSFDADLTIDGESGLNTFTNSASLDAGSGNITILCSNFSIGANIQSTGMLFIYPTSSGTTIGIGGGSGTLNLTDTELGYFVDGFSDIIIGNGSSGDLNINTAAFTDPVSLSSGTAIHDASGTDVTAPSIVLFGNTAPGQSPGILTVSGDFMFAEGASFSIEFGGTSPGISSNNHDQLSVSGTVTLFSATLNTTSYNGYSPSGNEQFTIIDNDGTDPVTGTFSGLPEGATVSSDFLSSGIGATITYSGGDGNDVVIEVNDPLPVELISFTAAILTGSVKLNWQTATEVNNYGFEVQRSLVTDHSSEDWTTVGFVQGNGNSNSPKSYEFIDRDPFGENPIYDSLKYRLKQIDTDGNFTYYSQTVIVDFNVLTDVSYQNSISAGPDKFELKQNYPNPFNPVTIIKYSIPVSALRLPGSQTGELELLHITLKIYDALGREAATLVNDNQSPGTYHVEFDASNLPSGIYYCRLTSGDFNQIKKLILLK